MFAPSRHRSVMPSHPRPIHLPTPANHMKTNSPPITQLRSRRVIAALSLALCASASAAVTMTDLTNVTLAASQIETGPDNSDNPDVTGGLGGVLVSYTETGSNAYGCCGGRPGTYGAHNLNDGDIGGSPTNQDGFYAIPDSGPGAVVITFTGGPALISGVAIYNGYANRDDGAYTLKDAAGNVLGGWTLSTPLGATNDGMDSFWLTFNTPVSTNGLVIDTVVGDCCGTPSFREIQVFAVPEPGTAVALTLAGLTIAGRRRRC